MAAPSRGGLVPLADLHQLVAFRIELLDGVDTVVGSKEGIVMGYIQAVGAVAEQTLAEAADEVALPVEHHDGVLAAGQDINVVLGIDGHAGAFVEGHSVRNFGQSSTNLYWKSPDP